MKKIAFTLSILLVLIVGCKNNQQKEVKEQVIEKVQNVEKKSVERLKLVLADMVSTSHNVEGFMMPNTINTLPGSTKNINNVAHENLKGHLSMTATVKLNDEIVGFATETEIIYKTEKGTEANSMWLIKLNKEGLKGFIAVEQIERAYDIDNAAAEMMAELKSGKTPKLRRVPTTTPKTKIQYASGDLAKYQGMYFTEYDLIIPNGGGIELEFYSAE